jgi:hypothetical protein
VILLCCNIDRVNTRTDRRLPFVALCLMLFQCQVFAASALGCLHANACAEIAAGSTSAIVDSCPHHAVRGAAGGTLSAPGTMNGQPSAALVSPHSAGGVDQADPGDLLDCAKCALSCSVSHYDRGPDVHALPALLVAAASPGLPIRHFYRYSPDSFLRPPIPTAG